MKIQGSVKTNKNKLPPYQRAAVPKQNRPVEFCTAFLFPCPMRTDRSAGRWGPAQGWRWGPQRAVLWGTLRLRQGCPLVFPSRMSSLPRGLRAGGANTRALPAQPSLLRPADQHHTAPSLGSTPGSLKQHTRKRRPTVLTDAPPRTGSTDHPYHRNPLKTHSKPGAPLPTLVGADHRAVFFS